MRKTLCSITLLTAILLSCGLSVRVRKNGIHGIQIARVMDAAMATGAWEKKKATQAITIY